MKNNESVYGFIGPAKGGKTYQLNALRKRANDESRDFITGDFSDGIRHTILEIFGLSNSEIDPSSKEYLNWKDRQQVIDIPGQLGFTEFRGRDLLKNVGEYLKTLAGEDVWARWTGNDICRKYWNLETDEDRDSSIVAFGSVRFGSEVNMLFNVASLINKNVKLIFCNHYDTKFDPNVHISESLAHQLILRGFKDGEDVTQAVKEIYKIK